MATFRNRSGKWQARVQIQGHSGLRVSDILCKRGSFTAEAFFPQT